MAGKASLLHVLKKPSSQDGKNGKLLADPSQIPLIIVNANKPKSAS
jgi:hypothetical protein